MANFLSNVLGNDSIAKIAGEKAGDIVESAVQKAMGGGGGEGEGEGKGKEEDKGGFGVNEAFKLIGEGVGSGGDDGDKKQEEGKGLDVTKALGGLFK